jgi:surface protein
MIHINLNDNDSEWKWEWIPFLATDKDGHNYFIALATYQKALAPESVTEISLSQIALDSFATNADVAAFDKTYNVLVHAQGIQSDGFGDVPEDALIEGFGRDIPFDMTLARGVDLYTALHYYGGTKGEDTKITDKVTSVTFGLNSKHEEVVSNTNSRAVLTSVEQDAEVYTYYIPNATDSNKYDLYVLADDTIYTPKISEGLFKDMTSLTIVDTTNMDVSRTENMTEMFKSCSALASIGVSNWKTGSVTDMSSMFYGCKNLTTLGVSAWDVSNVTKMNSVFESCLKINNLDVSDWDVSNVSTMSRMFARCNALTELKLNANPETGAWDVSKVSDMQVMFGWCSNLTCLEMKGWNTGNLTNMYAMFYLCENLRVVDVSDLDTQNVTDMSFMFAYCYALEEIKGLTNWETSSVTVMAKMFASGAGYNRYNLIKSLDLSSFDTSNVIYMGEMFQNSPFLETIYVGDGWNTDNVTESNNMFYQCPLLVGGEGTTIAQIDAIEGIEDTDVTNKTYAIVDGGPENPGYLTKKPAQDSGNS